MVDARGAGVVDQVVKGDVKQKNFSLSRKPEVLAASSLPRHLSLYQALPRRQAEQR
jgi:hypothetical protein